MTALPAHWELLRLKTCISNVVEQVPAIENGSRGIALESVESWTGRIHGLTPLDGVVKRFRRGDVLFGKLRPYLAKVARPEQAGSCVGEFLVLRPRQSCLDSAFAAYLLRSKPMIEAVNAATFGAKMPRAEWDFIGSMRIPVPPLGEQVAIVRFLDHADRRIRRTIRAKQKLIALLNEQNQAVIHGAVTRGLDPNVRLKPSGMPLLGDVPEHWDVRPAKYFFREVDERSETGTEELLSVSHIAGVTPRRERNVTMFMASSYVGQKTCQPGDLVINTMWAWMGALGVAAHAGIVSSAYGVYRPVKNSTLIGEYAELLLRTSPYLGEYICRSTGIRSSRLRLYPDEFLAIKVISPPPAEQRAILEATADARETTAAGISRAEREIALLREYRTRLIADVVTGQIDVCDAASRLPVESDEPEPLDDLDEKQTDEREVDELEPVEA